LGVSNSGDETSEGKGPHGESGLSSDIGADSGFADNGLVDTDEDTDDVSNFQCLQCDKQFGDYET